MQRQTIGILEGQCIDRQAYELSLKFHPLLLVDHSPYFNYT